MKILALYLPQFHAIQENDEWWGKGYTEWQEVKKAKKLYDTHMQPRVPLNNNYYDLSDESAETWKWQASLVNEYGIYGLCIYHYWFSSRNMLLEKPMEILLQHKEISLRYCICWANESWKRTWHGGQNELLMEQLYGEKSEWRAHFYYLLKFFRDERYIKIDNKPMINIYRPYAIDCMKEMLDLFNELAKENGFSGVYVVAGNTGYKIDPRTELYDAYYNYEPALSLMLQRTKSVYGRLMNKCKSLLSKRDKVKIKDANCIYEMNTSLLEIKNKKCFLGSFVGFDDTPRREIKGVIYNSSPQKFHDNLLKIDKVLKKNNRNDDFVYIMAWNEWSEGAYLEPDENNRYAYLEAIRKVVSDE